MNRMKDEILKSKIRKDCDCFIHENVIQQQCTTTNILNLIENRIKIQIQKYMYKKKTKQEIKKAQDHWTNAKINRVQPP